MDIRSVCFQADVRLKADTTIALLLALAFMAGGCGSKDAPATSTPAPPPAKPASTYTLRKVTLPDLSHAAPSVQQQLRDVYASLQKKVDGASTPTDQLALAYGQMGMLFLAAEYREEAEAALLDAQTFNPRDARWPYYLAQLYKIRGDAPKSAAAFARALELQPDDVPTLVRLGEARLDEGKPDAAEPLFAKALGLQPKSVAAQYGLGRVALAKQDYARAVTYLEKALSLDPLATIIHYPLAMAYRGSGDQAKAQAHLAQRGTLALKPDDPLMAQVDAMLHSAIGYEVSGADALDRGDWKAAAESFRKGIEVAPKEASLHHKLGTALALQDDGRGAVEEFERAIALDPSFSKAHYSLGVILASTGQPAAAIQRFQAALKSQPGYVEARLQLAHTLRRAGQPEASLAHYAQIVKEDARVPEARFGYAAALIRLKRFSEARDYLAAAITLYPNELSFANAEARVLAAAPEDKVRDGPRALRFVQPVLRHERAVDTLETMAMVQAELGQFTEAVTWQKEAIAAAERSGERGIASRIADNLRLYESRKPCRTPWRPDEPLEFQPAGPTVQSPAS
jgi:tetratricopeptide (TPR) repeat protein